MQLPHSDDLEVQYLSRLFDNTSECYKFFWFQAIVTKVLGGKSTFTYEELIDEMIADAWYMVTEYHLNLGPKDTLERCAKEHLNSMEIKGKVYRPGLDRDEFAGVLEEVVRPVYLSAKNC